MRDTNARVSVVHDDIERQKRYVRDGWNMSGDLCRRDEDGYFTFEARTDDMILTGGNNVSRLEGEAVACGMALEAQLGRALGITGPNAVDAIIETLTAYQLPTSPPGQTDAGRLLEIMRHDKKVRDASVRFALLESVGKMRRDPTGAWTTSVEEKVVRSVLETPER